MNNFAKIGIFAAVVLVVAAIVVLGTRDVPAPTGTAETELDDSRFPR